MIEIEMAYNLRLRHGQSFYGAIVRGNALWNVQTVLSSQQPDKYRVIVSRGERTETLSMSGSATMLQTDAETWKAIASATD